MGRPHKCPYCGATSTVSKGVRKTKTMGDRRIRLCKACKRKFTPRNQKEVVPTQDASCEGDAESRPGPTDMQSRGEPQSDPAEALNRMLPLPDQEWTS